MRKQYKLPVWQVYELLCERDPDWKHLKMHPKFKTLYDGWRAEELRQKKHSHGFYTLSWKRNWLPTDDWERFKNYALL